MRDEPRLEPPPERLSIAHLLVWTATSAVLLGYQRAMNSFSDGSFARFSDVVSFCYAPIFGAGLGALLLAAWRIANGGPRFPHQAGHWLLVVGGIIGIVSLSMQALLVLAIFQASIMPMMIGIRVISAVTSAICFALAVRTVRGHWRWIMLWAFVDSLLLLAGFLCVVMNSYWTLSMFGWEATLDRLLTTGIVVAAVVDLIRRERRDYLHWAGIVTRVAYTLLIFAIPFLLDWLRPTN